MKIVNEIDVGEYKGLLEFALTSPLSPGQFDLILENNIEEEFVEAIDRYIPIANRVDNRTLATLSQNKNNVFVWDIFHGMKEESMEDYDKTISFNDLQEFRNYIQNLQDVNARHGDHLPYEMVSLVQRNIEIYRKLLEQYARTI